MSCYVYELPTTGNIVFSEMLNDKTGRFTHPIGNATTARANLRAALKESKRTDDNEKDYLKIVKVSQYPPFISIEMTLPLKVIDDYLPLLYAIIESVKSGDLELSHQPGMYLLLLLIGMLLMCISAQSSAGERP